MTTPILRLKNWFAICVLLGALTMLFGDVRVQAADKDEEDALMLQVVPTVRFFTALDEKTHRAAVFLVDRDGRIVYKTNRLECNYTVLGQVEQPITDMLPLTEDVEPIQF